MRHELVESPNSIVTKRTSAWARQRYQVACEQQTRILRIGESQTVGFDHLQPIASGLAVGRLAAKPFGHSGLGDRPEVVTGTHLPRFKRPYGRRRHLGRGWRRHWAGLRRWTGCRRKSRRRPYYRRFHCRRWPSYRRRSPYHRRFHRRRHFRWERSRGPRVHGRYSRRRRDSTSGCPPAGTVFTFRVRAQRNESGRRELI